jgi:signal transduction histidine kinase/CheY-like chemotaxis protein
MNQIFADFWYGGLIILSLSVPILVSYMAFEMARKAHVVEEESEKRFRLLIREMQVGVLLLNAEAEILVQNQAVFELLNCPEREPTRSIFGQNWGLIGENGEAIKLEDLPVQRAIREHRSIHNGVVGLSLPEQQQRWLLVNADPQWNNKGAVERVVCTLSDITDQQVALRERKEAEFTLLQIAEQERAVARLIQRMRRTLDLKEIFHTTTEELRQVLECDRVLVYQFQPDWSGILVEESVAEGWKALVRDQDNRAELGQIAVNEENCGIRTIDAEADPFLEDTYLQLHQGGIYRQRTSYRCIPDIYAAGFSDCYIKLLEALQARSYIIVPIFCGSQLWGLLACYQNGAPREWYDREIKVVSQIGNHLGVAIQQAELFRQTQQQSIELKYAKEAADAANRSKSEFLASMSHELRTPLNAILGFTQLMRRDQSLNSQNQNYIEIINRSGEHLLDLINDILEMSKIEAGRATLNSSDFDLYALLDNLEDMLRLKASSKNLHLIFEREASVPQFIKTDKGKLRQVLINLLGNGIKFTEEGYVVLKIRNLDLGNLEFLIQDTGPGIAPEEIPLLFQPFTQTKTGLQSGEGTGLGLPISSQFVELMGGRLTVVSELGKGSTFCFQIPLEITQAGVILSCPLAAPQIIGLAPDQAIPKILVVEDILANRSFLVQLLQGIGFEVQEAENGQEAIDLWQDWQPDLILMDMRMPVMDGYQATRKIKSLSAGESTKIIALTASAFEEQRQSMLEAGCDDLVRKPFHEVDLLQKIGEHLGLRYLYSKFGIRSFSKGDAARTEFGVASVEGLGEGNVEVDRVPDTFLQAQVPDAATIDAQIATMPHAWVAQVHHAAAQGSDELLLKLLEEIPETHAQLQQYLDQLITDFRFDQVMELFKV